MRRRGRGRQKACGAAIALIANAMVALLAWVQPASAQTPPQNRVAEQAQRRAASGNLVGHGGPVKAIAVEDWLTFAMTRQTRALTGSFDYSAILWDVTNPEPKQLLRLADHNGAVNAVAFVPDIEALASKRQPSRALTAGDDSVVRLWDLATGKLVHKFEGHDPGSKIVALDVSRDGTWAISAGWDRTARLWNLKTLTAGPVLRDHKNSVSAAVFSGDASVIYTGSADGLVRAFDTAGNTLRNVVSMGQGITAVHRLRMGDAALCEPGGSTPTVCEKLSELEHLVVGAVTGQAILVDGRTGATLMSLADAERPILAVASLNSALIALGSADGRLRLLRGEGGSPGMPTSYQLIEDYKNPFGPVWALAMSPRTKAVGQQRLYYGGLDDFVTLWQASPRKPFEDVDASQYPRRFQMTGKGGDDVLAKGELQFARKCSICHTLTPDGANRAGPTLHNVFGRRIATLAGYNYSPELKTLDIVWNAETIAKLFELGPDKFTPGSKMPLQVMSDKGERDALITFLEQATK